MTKSEPPRLERSSSGSGVGGGSVARDYETMKATDHRRRQMELSGDVGVVNGNSLALNRAENAASQPSEEPLALKPHDGSETTSEPATIAAQGYILGQTPSGSEPAAILKLSRDLWPRVTRSRASDLSKLAEEHSTSSARPEETRNTSEEEVRRISPASVPPVNRFAPKPPHPLVHTEQLNASSPFLVIRQREAAELDTLDRRLSVLAATFAPSNRAIMLDEPANLLEDVASTSGEARAEAELLLPRLVVLNLEVGASSATLTWNVGLYPTTKELVGNNDSLEREHLDALAGRQKRGLVSRRVKRAPTRREETMRSRDSTDRGKDSSEGKLEDQAEEASEGQVPAEEETSTGETPAGSGKKREGADGEPVNELTVSRRLRLSRVQALPQDQIHRRPPVRGSTSTTTQRPAEEETPEVGEDDDSAEDYSTTSAPSSTTSSTSTTATSTSTSTKLVSSTMRPSSRPKVFRSFVANNSARLNRSRAVSTEAPMIKVLSVPLNRLQSSVGSPNSGSGFPTAIGRREPKAITERPPTTSTGDAEKPTITTTTIEPTEGAKTTSTSPQPSGSSMRPEAEPAKPNDDSSPAGNSSTTEVTRAPTSPEGGRSEEKSARQPKESKWLVRLRQFGSNEVDIVKVVVNNKSMQRVLKLRDLSNLRYIKFNKLMPASGYEICVESAGLNQQVTDIFQILNANHFLKCHDTPDQPELSNATSPSSANEVVSSDNKLLTKEPEVVVGGEGLARTKSLCREFFTLPTSLSQQTINFGLADDGGNANELLKNKTLGIQNLRKPKSLNNSLRSRMEVLEIGGGSDRRNMLFEMAASPVQRGNRLSPTASDTNFNILRALDDSPAGVLEPGQSAKQNNYLAMSMLPILGCVFGLIFILTMANMILNAISCRRTSSRAARRPARSFLSSSSFSTRRAGRRMSLAGSREKSLIKRQAGPAPSFYSENSDHSGTSKSRIVVVGKNGEPFTAATSGYFEMPLEATNQAYRSGELSSMELSQSSSTAAGSGGKRSSSNLVASNARFPLGPSFEGDERHNADMVGLARKNYDNFISNIYGASVCSSSAELEGALPVSQGVLSDKSRASHHKHRHLHHKSHRKGHPEEALARQEEEQLVRESKQAPKRSEAGEKRQRLRFDKINPIYNMDTFYATSGKHQFTMSSFVHSQPASDSSNVRLSSPAELSSRAPEGGDTHAGTSGGQTDCCQACEAERVQQDSPESFEECDGEDCDDGSFYTCCLDRQKQRFQEQQQQLEFVLTKNGALLPQPFINPSVPEACQPILQSEGSHTDHTTPAEPQDEAPPLATLPPEAKQAPTPPPPPPPLPLSDESGAQDENMRSVTLPLASSAAPQSQLLAGSQTNHRAERKTNSAGSQKSALINIQSMGGTMINDKGRLRDEKLQAAINKSDFNERRKELANKLNLVGMSRPSS